MKPAVCRPNPPISAGQHRDRDEGRQRRHLPGENDRQQSQNGRESQNGQHVSMYCSSASSPRRRSLFPQASRRPRYPIPAIPSKRHVYAVPAGEQVFPGSRSFGQFHRRTRNAVPAGRGMVQFRKHVPDRRLRMLRDVLEITDERRRDPGRLQAGNPFRHGDVCGTHLPGAVRAFRGSGCAPR